MINTRRILTAVIVILATVFLTDADVNECGEGCSACGQDMNSNFQCTACLERYRLDGAKCTPCPDKCLRCPSENYCTLCQSPYYGRLYPHCTEKCPQYCNASGCDATDGTCFGCEQNHYGLKCAEDCTLCTDGLCDFVNCRNGCKNGYFQSISNKNYSYCSACKKNCKECSNFTHCSICEKGYFLFDAISACIDCRHYKENCSHCSYDGNTIVCDTCEVGYSLEKSQCIRNTCPLTCLGECDTNDTCVHGCQDGSSGEKCDALCNESCKTCDQFDKNKCVICKDNTHSCLGTVPCNVSCAILNGISACDVTGLCLHGCLNGYWKKACNQSCSDGCNSGCDRKTGKCLNCKPIRYGEFCEHYCSKNCLEKNAFDTVCIQDNGTCLQGCKDGFYGPNCNSMLHPTLISANNGTILNNAEMTTNTHSLLKSEDVSNIPVISGVSSGAGLILIGIILGLTFCLYRRSKQKKRDNETYFGGENIVVDDLSGLGNALGVVDIASDTTPIEKHDYIYAKPIKARKSQPRNDDSLVNASDDRSVDLLEERRQNEDLDISEEDELEEVDEDAPTNNRTDYIPTSDTYYNMAGLKRSRIMVTDLSDYIKGKSDFEEEFEKLPCGLIRTCNEALKPNNRSKNRYNNLYAYDATRVVLLNNEFINASYIDGHDASPEYIASLGPVKSAMSQFATFWEMIWQENSRKIVMLTNLKESEKMKCEQYWPDEGSLRMYRTISVKTTVEHIYAEFVVREFQVTKTGKTREIIQYHYTAWQDKSIPDTVASLLEFRDMVEKRSFQNSGPMVVHCSAGIGRTGTYIALDTIIKEGKEDNSVDIFGCVMALRGQRVNMVQNVEQYIFLHHCVAYALTCDPKPLDISSIIHAMTDDSIHRQFQNLTNLALLPNKESDTLAANRHRKENRKGADIPGDLHRVKLRLTKRDYVNAVYLDGYRQINKYIVAQTPMTHTLEDFVSMLYQEDVECIISLDDETQHEKNVGQYIPPANKVSKCGHFQIQCKTSSTGEGVLMRQLHISRIGSPPNHEKNIKQFQMNGWNSDANLPECRSDVLHLLDSLSNYSRSGKGKILVHCLDGATRSGMFCAIAIMLEKLTVEKEVSVINTVCQVRGRRRTAVKEYDQFRFCYSCIQEHLETVEYKTYYNIL